MSQQSAQETKLAAAKQELQAAEQKLQAAEASKNDSLIASAKALLDSTTKAVTYWSTILYSFPATAGPPLPSSPNSKSSQSSSSSSDGSGEYTLRIHSSDVELIHRGISAKSRRLRDESGTMGSKQILVEIAAIKTHLEKSETRRVAAETELKQAQLALLTERHQRETERVTLETELKQVMAHLQRTLASQTTTTTDQPDMTNNQGTHHTAKQEQKQGSSLISRFRAAWRSSSGRESPRHRHASSPISGPAVPSEAATSTSSTLSVSSLPTTPPHPRTTSAFSSPLSTQPMGPEAAPGTAVAVSSSSSIPRCPVCHEPIDDDLYEMAACGHSFHLACARFVWKQQHGREDTPFCIFPHCGAPVKHSPTKRLARIVEESSSRSNSDISDPSHRSMGQTNPSFDRQSIGSHDTVVSQTTTVSTSTESNQPQPQTKIAPIAASSSSSSAPASSDA